ncbi:substrate-binding domain-containing protein, partial [Litorivicinus sp.]|nr:substrate-binding domain-containing protein [Litorivicinus sp.]
MTLKETLRTISIALFIPLGSTLAVADSIIVQSTTSTKNSGLYDHILPIVKEDTGITVNVVAVGTGQAIKNAQRCDGDVLLVHAKSSEEKFVAQGFGIK